MVLLNNMYLSELLEERRIVVKKAFTGMKLIGLSS